MSYTPDKTKDHDEIVIRLKDGRRVRIYDTTDVKFPDRTKYLDYVRRAKKGPVLYEQAPEREFV